MGRTENGEKCVLDIGKKWWGKKGRENGEGMVSQFESMYMQYID